MPGGKVDVPRDSMPPTAQRLVVLIALLCLCGSAFLWPDPGRPGSRARAALPACSTSPTPLSGLVNGNTLSLGNGTTVTPCIANAPLHLRIGYSDGATGGSTGSGTAFTTDGITFPDGKYTMRRTGCALGITSDTTIAKPTILKFADGTQSAGPANRDTFPSPGFLSCGTKSNVYAANGWPTTFAQSDDAMLVHMRLKNLQINRNAFMTVTPQSNPAAPTVAGTGEYSLTFAPGDQGSAGWNIGDSCVFTDLWLRADAHIKVNIFGINTTVGSLAGDDSLWGSILSSIASMNDVPGLELDGWVYYMNSNKGSDCTGSPTTLNLPSTRIGVAP
jgi:hypothetical protein